MVLAWEGHRKPRIGTGTFTRVKGDGRKNADKVARGTYARSAGA